MSDMLVEAIQKIKRSTDIKFVVIKDAGNTFCAGDDIKEMFSAGLSGAVNGFWEVSDADQGSGVQDFTVKGDLWQRRRTLSKNFWTD